MILPDVFSDVTPHPIPVNPDVTVTVGLRLVPARLWDDIITHHKNLPKDAADRDERFWIARVAAGIAWIEATGSERVQFGPPLDKCEGGDPTGWPLFDDGRAPAAAAVELWKTWPTEHRTKVYRAVVGHNEGWFADPKERSTSKANDADGTSGTGGPPESPTTTGNPSPPSDSGTTAT